MVDEPGHPLRVGATECFRFPRHRELLERKGAYGLEEAVAARPRLALELHEGFSHQRGEGGSVVAHRARRIGRESTREDTKPPQQGLLVLVEELVRPFERRAQRLMTVDRPAAP